MKPCDEVRNIVITSQGMAGVWGAAIKWESSMAQVLSEPLEGTALPVPGFGTCGLHSCKRTITVLNHAMCGAGLCSPRTQTPPLLSPIGLTLPVPLRVHTAVHSAFLPVLPTFKSSEQPPWISLLIWGSVGIVRRSTPMWYHLHQRRVRVLGVHLWASWLQNWPLADCQPQLLCLIQVSFSTAWDDWGSNIELSVVVGGKMKAQNKIPSSPSTSALASQTRAQNSLAQAELAHTGL